MAKNCAVAAPITRAGVHHGRGPTGIERDTRLTTRFLDDILNLIDRSTKNRT